MKPSDTGVIRIVKATGYSYKGIVAAWRGEAAFRQEVVLTIMLFPVALFAEVSPVEHVLLVGVLGLVLIVELLNSAIEAVVDRIGSEAHELSGAAKDMGSAAVFVSLALAFYAWGWILTSNN